MRIISYQFNWLLHYLKEGDFLIDEANKFRVKPKFTTNYKKKNVWGGKVINVDNKLILKI